MPTALPRCSPLFARALACAALMLAPTTASAEPLVVAIGNPKFLVSDFHLFSAPIGTYVSDYAEFKQTLASILPAPNHVLNPTLDIGPGAPHAGPYTAEIGAGVAANGYATGTTFTTRQYSNGMAVYLAFMLTPGPGAPLGQSPDFASGPILPTEDFPLSIGGSTYTNGTFNDSHRFFQLPALNAIPGFEGDTNHSHIPVFFADNFYFASRAIPGSYEYRIFLVDAQSNGYAVTAAFEVNQIPEPASMILLASGGLVAGMLFRRRKCALPLR